MVPELITVGRRQLHRVKVGCVTVPGHPCDDAPKGTLPGFNKQTGLRRRDQSLSRQSRLRMRTKFAAYVIGLDGVTTTGQTIDEAIEDMREVIPIRLEGDEISEPMPIVKQIEIIS
jgi:predicted RNase H-like HicB family nuclease